MKRGIVMMVIFLTLLSVLWQTGAALAQEKPTVEAMKKFQGTWVLTSAEMDGKKVDDAAVKQSTITFTGNRVELINPHQHKDVIVADITRINYVKKPGETGWVTSRGPITDEKLGLHSRGPNTGEMQWVRSRGPNTGVTMTAKFEFRGPDSYVIVFDPKGSAPPATFATTPGSGHIMQVWKRAKK